MNEIFAGERMSARPEQYINTVSGTIVTIVKTIEGIFAGYALFSLIRTISPFLSTVLHETGNVIRVLEKFISELGFSREVLQEMTESLLPGFALPAFIWLIAGILVLTGLVMVVVEAVSLLMLRFGGKGASAVKTVHQIDLLIAVIALGLLAYSVVEYIRTYQKISAMNTSATVSTALFATNIALTIIVVVCLIALILQIFYHKDIASAMRTVTYETETGYSSELKRTHLSGISLFLALPYALLLIGEFAGLSKGSYQTAGNTSQIQTMLANAVVLLLLIKQMAVCFCNGNLKKAHR